MNKPDVKGSAPVHGVHDFDVWFLPGPGKKPEQQHVRVVEEDALTIDVEDVGTYTLMWTPTEGRDAMGFTAMDGVLADSDDPEALALAAGFCFTEGIIQSIGDVKTMALCADSPGIVQMALKDPESVVTRRKNVIMTSSCGICGGRDIIDNNVFGLEPVSDTLRLSSDAFARLMEAMRNRQEVFSHTGGAHAAGIFNAEGEILVTAEDLGRHNALDKVIGKAILLDIQTRGCGVVLSSRLSLEMVTKAVRAGLEVVAAVSAPTSLAIEVAREFGITLCGFVRGQRSTVYSHPRRIEDLG